ncbi:GNAT family N-acetyltransferase [Saccharopolyspora rhizosphaerae]|uniref:GNAT family N-acetyltransferase n=1 Tax=Saccharopolyspora rhizosphaerae TaxID=2492662 RepID=A0A3R8Q8M4_9PSEU|nr:GNAT family N-acetyltransferase [Saccharopolyspora rhizosphaerae]RRO19363.1 GNAT family N-acetyltransferase [Saccharopolyspora rhizosphaerae]
MGNLEARKLDAAEHEEFPAVFAAAFLEDSEEELARFRPIVPHVTALGVFDGPEMIGTAGHHDLTITLPGGRSSPVAGVTTVGVKPGHRRRGVLTALMREQLDQVRGSAVPLAVLYASEGAIYGRFGYGVATFENHLALPAGARFRADVEVDERPVREVDRDRALPVVHEQHTRIAATRVGWTGRGDGSWEALELMRQKRDGLRSRYALHPDGHVIYRAVKKWTDRGPDYGLVVTHLMAETPRAYAALWRYLVEFDLVREVAWKKAAVDEPIVHLLTDPRAADQRVVDGLWLRLVDVPAALAARGLPDDVVVEVGDSFCPWNQGRWRLNGEPATAPAQLSLDVADLAAAYLGGTTLVQLAAAGRVRELEPGALAAASRALATDRAPNCPDAF